MRYVVLSSLIFSFLLSSNAWGVTRQLGYRSTVLGTQGLAIRSMALRSDGRFLFFSTGGTSLYVLDMQDFARQEVIATLNESIIGIALLSDQRLGVVTTGSVRYFKVTDPFDIEQETAKYEKPSGTGTTSSAACFDSQKRSYIFEDSSTELNSIVRVVSEAQELGKYSWADIFGSSSASYVSDYEFVCMKESVLVLGKRMQTVDGASRMTELWAGIPGHISGRELDLDLTNYSIRDITLAPDSSELIVLLNRRTAGQTTDDSVAAIFDTSSFASPRLINLGSAATAASAFSVGEQIYYSFFVGKDYLLNIGDPDLDVLLLGRKDSIGALSPFGTTEDDRGLGSSSTGSRGHSLTVSSKSDHYKVLRSNSTGLELLTQGPLLEFTEDPSGLVLTSADGGELNFKFRSTSSIRYQIRFNENLNDEKGLIGLSNTPGKLIREGSAASGEEVSLQISKTELGITRNGTHSLYILAYDSEEGSSGLMSRLGFRFSYDPPPDSVRGFKVLSGDQAIRVQFGLPVGGDLAGIYIHFSTVDQSSDGIIASAETITKANGSTLTSPISIPLDQWDGAYVIHPLVNDQTLYLTAQVIDKSSQLSDPVAAQSGTPRLTKSLSQAFGSLSSCSLTLENGSSRSDSKQNLIVTALLNLLVLIFVAYLRRTKA